MDEIIKSQEKTNGESASEVQSLSEMPSFEKHMAEIESGVENDEKAGEIDEPKNSFGVEALISEPDGNKESKGFLEFEKKHPELAAEMRELDVPLNEKEFKEQGYSFYPSTMTKDQSGTPTMHLRRETAEFRDWKKSHPGEEPPANMRLYAPIDKVGVAEASYDEQHNRPYIVQDDENEPSTIHTSTGSFSDRILERNGGHYSPHFDKMSSGVGHERNSLETMKKERQETEDFLAGKTGYFMDKKDLQRCEKLGVDPAGIENKRFQRAVEVVEKMDEDELNNSYEKIMQEDADWKNYDFEKQRLPISNELSEKEKSIMMVRNREVAQNLLLRDVAEGTRTGYGYNHWWYKGREYESYPEYTRLLMSEIGDDNRDKLFEALEIDTEGIGEKKRALLGFANTLSAVNGEKTDQANWYFETFKFNEDWDEFLSAMGVVGEKRGAGFKKKLTMFLNKRAEWSERNDKIKSEKEARKLTSKNDFARLGGMREVSLDYINAYVDALRGDADLDDDYFPVKYSEPEQLENNETVAENADNESAAGDNGKDTNNKLKNTHNDETYGKMKVAKLGDWCDYIQKNVDSDAKFYIESIGVGDKRIRGEYLAVQFTMGDKTYCIAESIKDNAAMYLAYGEAGEDIREYFRTLSKREARKDDHINVIYHLDKDNFGDSLDQCYAKAFFLLFGGKKSQKDFGKTQVFPVGAQFTKYGVGRQFVVRFWFSLDYDIIVGKYFDNFEVNRK